MFVILLVFSYVTINQVQNILGQGNHAASILSSALDVFLLLAAVFPATLTGSIAFMAFSVERDQRTLEHLLSLPLTDDEVFLGKLLAAVLAGLAGLVLVFSVVIGYTVLSNAVVWDAPLFDGSLTMLVFAVSPLLIALFAVVAVVLSCYLSSREAYMTNLVSMGCMLGIFAMRITLGVSVFMFNVGLTVVLVSTIVFLFLFGVRKFNRETLMSRL
jgi:ABC-2 type transport system permease protein